MFKTLLTSAIVLFVAVTPTRAQPAATMRDRLGINLDGPAHWSSMRLFANAMREARPWQTISDQERWEDVTPEGYPQTLPEGVQFLTFPGNVHEREPLPDVATLYQAPVRVQGMRKDAVTPAARATLASPRCRG